MQRDLYDLVKYNLHFYIHLCNREKAIDTHFIPALQFRHEGFSLFIESQHDLPACITNI